jgi:ABC-2 type transport system ATP-binding protein
MCKRAADRSLAGMKRIAIEVHDLHKTYGGRSVLGGLTFAVGEGEIFGIAGRNGAGKTTTVEILQGLRGRDAGSGSVEVLGFDPARERRRLRPLVGAQLQTSALPDRLRVGEALRLFARLAGDVVDWRALAREWRLEELLAKPFATLSGGQRQRLFLALTMVNRPRLVFLDELTQGLDPAARRETWRLIERARDAGTTVVLVTHDMDEAERLCDRVAVLDDGRLVTCGRPVELVTATGTVRVRFSSPGGAGLEGLDRIPGVGEIGYDGGIASVTAAPIAVVPLAGELARRSLAPADFTVIRPSLEDAVVSLLNGGSR